MWVGQLLIELLASKSGNFFAIGAIPDTQKAVFPASDDGGAVWRAGGCLHEIGELGDGSNLTSVVIDDANEIVTGGGDDPVSGTDELERGHFFGPSFDFLFPLT